MNRNAPLLLSWVACAALATACASGGLSSPPEESGTNNGTADNNAQANNGADCPTSACSIGQSICTASDEVQICQDDGTGCGAFGLSETCVDGQVCIDGRCTDGCIDTDGDGHGNGCANGPDCDDTDFDKHADKTELCDNKDNDCDGDIDEGDACAGDCTGQECVPGERECASGTAIRECRPDNNGCGSWGPDTDCGGACATGACEGCVDSDGDQRGDGCAFGPDCNDNDGTIYDGAPELCDNADNDCDNMTDEGDVCAADCSGQPCTPGAAECVSGTELRECQANEHGCGVWSAPVDCGGTCQGNACLNCVDNDGDNRGAGCPLGSDCDDDDDTIYQGATELCDGEDNDCDGDTDEDFADKGDACASGLGACRRTGTRVCSAGGFGTVCDASPGSPTDEVCGDGADNDCDDQIDEGFQNLGQGCTDGVGQCTATGQLVCDGTSLRCTANATSPSTEVCDMLDNDCDGQADEGGVCTTCIEDGHEPNDRTSEAPSLARGQSITGVVCGSGGSQDRDWYRLGDFSSGQSMTVDVTINNSGCEMHLEIYTPSAFKQASGGTTTGTSLSYTANESNTYYVWVHSNSAGVTGCAYTVTQR